MSSASITTRIGVGFFLLGAILASVLGYSYYSVNKLGTTFKEYRQTARQTLFVNDVIEDLFEARIAALKYREQPSTENAEDVQNNIAEITEAVQDLSLFEGQDSYQERLAESGNLAVSYKAAFRDLMATQSTTQAILNANMASGDAIYTALTELSLDARNTRNAFLQFRVGQLYQSFAEARSLTAQYVLSTREEYIQSAVAEINETMTEIEEIRSLTRNENQAQFVEDMSSEIVTYKSKAEELKVSVEAELAIATGQLDQIGPALQNKLEEILNSVVDRQNTLGPDGAALVGSVISSMPIVGAASLIFAMIGAFLSGRWVSVPLKRLVEKTRQLAEGNVDIKISGAEHKHELGQLAQALLVFRQAHIDRDAQIKEGAERARAEQANVVQALQAGLMGLADGDLTKRIEQEFPSDYEQLRLDFNETIDRLHSTIQSVIEATGEIRNGAGEITSSSEDLTRRTENQAATLEETAAAVEEMTVNLKATAKGAAQTNAHMADAKKSAGDGHTIVKETIEAMNEIQTSSKQISQIIKVIEDIAFQTNLLALNAGVEAARAGESGRGFAVVASEVRVLAQRSSEAAKEIKELIENSAKTVTTGASLVEKTGTALNEIVEVVNQVSTLVAEIDTGTNEQSTGIDEINTAVTQLDQVTQQNAAMAEEAHAACAVLTKETDELGELTKQFKTRIQRGQHAIRGAA